MKEFYTPAEAVGWPGLPRSIRKFNELAEREGWRRDPERARKRAGKGGGWEYHVSLLPGVTQAAMLLAEEAPSARRADIAPARGESGIWERYERLSSAQKQACERRLKALVAVETLTAGGLGVAAAARKIARREGVSAATVFNWRERVCGLRRADWLAALAPRHGGAAIVRRAACDARAYEALKSDYLRPERPGFAACYRRMAAAAQRHGWAPIPSERALRRHLAADVPAEAMALARQGRDSAKALFPAQRRTRDHLTALAAVNMDGHRLDVFARSPDGRIVRYHLLALQDLYSNKILAWRLSESENKETVRLVIGDMVAEHGIPDAITLDNGRAFASKWITGGAANRYRFTVREEEPQGLITALGIAINWTLPYSGQSKPIERAFRDFCDDIARHPAFAGAYTGNRPDAKPENYATKAVPFDDFRRVVAAGIAEHNARPGRRTAIAQGRSFDEVFADSMAAPGTIVRRASEKQQALWLLAADRVRTRKGSGEIHFCGNRYWDRALNAHGGRQVTVRFDPDALLAGVRVYDAADRLICEAACIDDAGFDSIEAAKAQAKTRNAYLRATAETKRLHAALSADELARLYDATIPSRRGAPAAPETPRPKTVRMARPLRGAAAAAAEPLWNEEMAANFSRGLRLIAGTDVEEDFGRG